jgi:hypothetical protein
LQEGLQIKPTSILIEVHDHCWKTKHCNITVAISVRAPIPIKYTYQLHSTRAWQYMSYFFGSKS